MNTPRRICIAIGAMLLIGGNTGNALAQWGPYGSGGWFGGWGSAEFNVGREIHQQDRAQAQAFAASRNARIGNEVRGTLLNEANARTQASIAQQQSARDWWFQTQSRQMAERSARAQAAHLPPLAYAPLNDASFAAAEPRGDSLIRWPAVLSEPQFAAERSTIEGPFVRFARGGAAVTAAEYDSIIAAAATMKQQLDLLVAQITAADYLAATKFLDQMTGEARQRTVELTAPSPKS